MMRNHVLQLAPVIVKREQPIDPHPARSIIFALCHPARFQKRSQSRAMFQKFVRRLLAPSRMLKTPALHKPSVSLQGPVQNPRHFGFKSFLKIIFHPLSINHLIEIHLDESPFKSTRGIRSGCDDVRLHDQPPLWSKIEPLPILHVNRNRIPRNDRLD